MDKLDKIFLKILNENLTQIVISGRKKNAKVQRGKEVRKIKIRPVLIKEQLLFQVEEFTEKQAFHHNFSKEETGLISETE